MKLIMRRTGQFDCHWQSTQNKCGTSDKLQTAYTYACEIKAKPVLDSRGFLFDQLEIDKYFQERYWSEQGFPARSCEQMAIDAAEDIAGMLDRHFYQEKVADGVNFIVDKISVSIGHGASAVMIAIWEPTKK